MDFLKNTGMNLNSEQIKAVTHHNGPALVLAGPGSGKTTVIISRLAYLVMNKGVDPQNILSMTFNRAAAREMEHRFEKKFKSLIINKCRFSTLHSFSYSVVKWYEQLKGIHIELIEGTRKNSGKRAILKDIIQKIQEKPVTEDKLENVMNDIGFVKNKMIKNFNETNIKTRNFSKIFKKYEEYKKDNKLFDFDDMLVYSYLILKKYPRLLKKYRKKYKYLQIDEGQDMSKIQFEIVKLLVQPVNNLFLVADDDQSIYGFRGAEPEYILDFKKNYEAACIYYMGNNYRSTKNIVELSSSFIRRNLKRYDKKHTTVNERESDPEIIEVKDENAQAEYILKRVRNIVYSHKENAAVLYRNNLSSILVADALERNGTEFCIRESNMTFFNNSFILDILAFLNFSVAPWDTDSFLRICFKTGRYISKDMIEFAINMGKAANILDNMLKYRGLNGFAKRKIKQTRNDFKRMSTMRPVRALKVIKNDFKYLETAGKRYDRTDNSSSFIKKLFWILEGIAGYHVTINSFLARIAYLQSVFANGSKLKPETMVTLSTVHSVKGLEYDNVFMMDLYNGEFPALKSIEHADNHDMSILEEERRLFYVGMTRARKHLHFLYPRTAAGKNVERSVFLNETDEYAKIK